MANLKSLATNLHFRQPLQLMWNINPLMPAAVIRRKPVDFSWIFQSRGKSTVFSNPRENRVEKNKPSRLMKVI